MVLFWWEFWYLLALLCAHISQPCSSFVKLAAIGDHGVDGAREADVAKLVASWNPEAILALGDVNYPKGSRGTIDQNVGKHYSQFIFPYKGQYGSGSPDKRNRYWPCPGNHDYGNKDHGDLTPYLEYMPVRGRHYYDVRLGPVHIFSLDSSKQQERSNGSTSTLSQAHWLRMRLAASTAPWKLVFFHHPPHSSGPHGGTAYMRWPFEDWGATLVMSGHDHSYERIVPYNSSGFPYFVNGLGGARTYGFRMKLLPGSSRRFTGDGGAQLIEADSHSIWVRFVSASTNTTHDCYGAVRTWAGSNSTHGSVNSSMVPLSATSSMMGLRPSSPTLFPNTSTSSLHWKGVNTTNTTALLEAAARRRAQWVVQYGECRHIPHPQHAPTRQPASRQSMPREGLKQPTARGGTAQGATVQAPYAAGVAADATAGAGSNSSGSGSMSRPADAVSSDGDTKRSNAMADGTQSATAPATAIMPTNTSTAGGPPVASPAASNVIQMDHQTAAGTAKPASNTSSARPDDASQSFNPSATSVLQQSAGTGDGPGATQAAASVAPVSLPVPSPSSRSRRRRGEKGKNRTSGSSGSRSITRGPVGSLAAGRTHVAPSASTAPAGTGHGQPPTAVPVNTTGPTTWSSFPLSLASTWEAGMQRLWRLVTGRSATPAGVPTVG